MNKWSDFEFIDFDAIKISRKLEELGHQWAEKKQQLEAAKVAYDKSKSSAANSMHKSGMSATLVSHAKYDSEEVSFSGQELSDAYRLELEARTSYEAAKAFIEIKRSVLSTERAAMNLR